MQEIIKKVYFHEFHEQCFLTNLKTFYLRPKKSQNLSFLIYLIKNAKTCFNLFCLFLSKEVYLNCSYQLLIESSYQIWVGFIFVNQKSINKRLKLFLWVQNHLLNLCSSHVNSQRYYVVNGWCVMFVLKLSGNKGYYIVKKLVWNVCSKAFWFTIYVFDSDLVCQMQ